MIKCDFYRNDAGDFFMTLPRLPIVAQKTATIGPLPEDYRDFPDKISGWFEVAEKRLKKKPDWPSHKKRYPCVWCDWSFDATVKLAKHRYVHRNIGVFACQVCLTLFNHHYNLYQHWRMSCTPVTKSKSDHEMKNIDISTVRNYVLCAMGTENRAQSYHVFGGVFFIPSQWFLDTKYNVIDPHEQNDCHLCHLAVPTKFLECHGDVHRGRFRIDGKIYGDYFCHICGKIFRSRCTLLEHWRLDCPEVVYYLPEDVALDDEELVGFAWLILQMAIAHDKILIMAKNSSLALEKWAHRHAKENNMIYLLDRYYHYPQELWPLKLETGEDIIRDAIPIFGTRAFLRSINGEVTLYNPDIAVHIANLIATACPDFYATGAVFTEILGCESKTEATKSVFRIVLRYTTAGSVISTYKINLRTCPSLRVSRPSNLSRSPGDYNVEEDFTAHFEESRKMSTTDKNNQDYTWSCVGRMRDQLQRNNWLKRDALEYTCRICRKILGQRSAREHWMLECAPLGIILPKMQDRSYMDEGLETSIAKQMKKVGAKVYIDWVRRKEERADSGNFQSVDRIGEYNKTTFYCSDAGLEQIRKGSAKAMSNAMRRYTERFTAKKCMVLETQSAVVCPHCGGRMSAARLILHLEQRHFYDAEAKNQEGCQADFRSATVDDTYELVKDIIEKEEDRLGREMMPMMSEEQYRKCVAAHQDAIRSGSDIPDREFESNETRQEPWMETTTIRQVHLIDCPLALMRSNLGLITLEEPEKLLQEDLEPFHPLAKIVRETDVNHENAPGSAGDVWLPPNLKIKIPAFQETDPTTGDALADDYAAIQRTQNAEFFGDFLQEALTNGLSIRSIAEFYANRTVGKRRGDGDEYGDDDDGLFDDLDGADNERSQFSDGPDGDSDYDDRGDDDDDDDVDYGEVTGEEDEDGGATSKRKMIANDDEPLPIVRQRGRHDNTDPSEETLESMQQRLQHRRQEKKKHREMSDRVPNKPQGEFDKTHFEPLPINMGPRKTQSLNFLSVVVKNTADIDHRADHKRLSAFSVDWENCASDFRESGAYFRKWYKKRLPPQTKGTKVSEMDPRDLENALKIEEMAMEGKVAGVVDENGVVYLNGYITPWTTRDYDHDTVVKIIKDGWVRQFKVFNCKDGRGKFKFYWPYHRKTDTASKFCESFDRLYFDEQQERIDQIIASKEKYLPATCFLRNYTTRNPSRNKVDGSDDSVKDEQSDQSTDNEAPPPALKKTKSTRKKLDDLATTKIAKISPKKARKRRITEDSEEDSDDDDDDDVGKMILESSDEVSSEDFEDSEGSGDEDMSNYFLNQRAGPPEEQEEEEEAPEASSGVPEEPEEPEKQRERPSGFSIDSILGSK
ncbi:hypothetical protein L5515_000138 [Caenorhabditis briggsae]|uniref:C2H2-type domain-containing protein n=1 Tax=Caenorhabditis briggsae TaxID=6238 RepID=A0AAE9DZ44_CAEBR|nr:hypothetical protein L5515_000138 [Caenorhabditis briggsae]